MHMKANFSAEEWKILQYSVLWMFYAIAEVDGMVDENEMKSLFDSFGQEDYFGNPLTSEVLASIGEPDVFLEEFKGDKLGVPMGLKTAAELVETKLSAEDARAFKRSLLFMGVTFAKATEEVPGDTTHSRISEEEKAAILTVAAILRLSLEDLNI